MIAVDTSAIVAYLRREPEAEAKEERLASAREIWMSAFTVFECRTVLFARFGPHAAADFELLVANLHVRVAPFDLEQCEHASEAYRRFTDQNRTAPQRSCSTPKVVHAARSTSAARGSCRRPTQRGGVSAW